MEDNEFSMKGQVMSRLNLDPGISDAEYELAVRDAMVTLDGYVGDDPPNYPRSETDACRVESKYMSGSGQGVDQIRRQYQDKIIFASQGVPFFWITASAFKRCEALILEFVALPVRPIFQTA